MKLERLTVKDDPSKGYILKKKEFEAKFIANLALFLSHAAKFNAQKLHADARCHDP